MKKFLKWTGITLLVLIVLIIVAPFLFKGKIVAKIKEEANNNLNAKVDFGDFDLTLIKSFPRFTLRIDNVSVANINEFEGDTLFSAKELSVSLNLMSVIKGSEYDIRAITLDHPRIKAHVMKDGKANWDISKVSADTAKAVTPSESSKFKMSLKKLEIISANLIYDDRSLDFYTSLENLNHTLSGDFTQDNFALNINTAIDAVTVGYGGVTYLNRVKTVVNAEMDADMPNFKFTFKQSELGLNELSFGVEGYFAMPQTDMDMDLKFNAKQSEFKNFLSLVPAIYSKDFASIKTSGKLAFDGFVKGIYNDKTMPAFSAHIMINDAMLQYPSLPKAVKDIAIDVKIDNKDGLPDHTIIDINKFHMEMADNPIDIKMHVSTPVSDANINGAIMGKINLATIKDVVPLDKEDNLSGNITADMKLSGRVSTIEAGKYDEFNAAGTLIVMDVNYKSPKSNYDAFIKSMTLNFSSKFVELAGFDAMMNGSDLKADGRIDNLLQYVFKKELLKGTFNIQSDNMDMNKLMTSSSTTGQPDRQAGNQQPTTADTTSLSVIPVPANIDFMLIASIKKLLYSAMEINDLSGIIHIHDSEAELKNLKMKTMGGSLAMSGTYDTRNIDKPKFDLNLDATDFDIPKTAKAFATVEKLAPVAKYTNGRVSTQLNINSELDKKMMPVMSTLNGNGTLNTKSVVVAGFEPMNKLADALKNPDLKKAAFGDLNLTYHIKDGRVTTDPFDVKIGSIKAKAGGSTGIDQTIDYVWNMEIPRAALGSQANDVINGLVSKANSSGANVSVGDIINVKALFGGTVLSPTVKTDLKDAGNKAVDDLKDAAKQKAQEELDKAKAEAEKKVNEELGKAKADAQKKLDDEKAKAQAEADRLKAEAEQKAKEEADKLKEEGKNKLKDLFKKPK